MSETANDHRLFVVIERNPDTSVVRCKGRLVAGFTESFQDKIKPLIPGCKRIVVDMKEVTHMDSMGLGTLVRLYVSAKSAGCSLELANIGPSVRHLLGVTHLISVLSVIGEYNVRF